jgi:hypothetical protein
MVSVAKVWLLHDAAFLYRLLFNCCAVPNKFAGGGGMQGVGAKGKATEAQTW